MSGEEDARLSVVVTLLVKPGYVDEFLRLLGPVLDAMRHEPSFINAVLHRDPADPSRFMLYETWADRTDLVEVQMKRACLTAYEARLPELLREPRRGRGVAAAAWMRSGRRGATGCWRHTKKYCLSGPVP